MFKKKLLLALIAVVFIFGGFLFIVVKSNVENSNVETSFVIETKQLIKKYFFPHRIIRQQKQELSKIKNQLTQQKQNIRYVEWSFFEVNKKKELSEISTKESVIELSDNFILKKYKLTSGFYAGIHIQFPGSGYIDFHENKIFVLSSRGVLALKNNLENVNENFIQIENNINEFIGIKQFKKSMKFSIKDLSIINNKIYVSYTDEIKDDCWNTSIIYGDINYEKILFKKLFVSEECIDSQSLDKIDPELFTAGQSGGRISPFDDNHILLSNGEYRNRFLAQDKSSTNGKIIKINVEDKTYQIISMGHRNPQGLYYDKENNFILETEHGPLGGDEINLIEIDKINNEKIQNYGWPISSYGEHYPEFDKDGWPLKAYSEKYEGNKIDYKKGPLFKSHSEQGFIEPLLSFVPSISISEIIKIGKNDYVVSSMGADDRVGDRSLYFFEIDHDKKLINLKQVKVFERVRDIKFQDNKLYMFMENTASIGVISLN